MKPYAQKMNRSFLAAIFMAMVFITSFVGATSSSAAERVISREVSSAEFIENKNELAKILLSLVTIENPRFSKSYMAGLKNTIKDIQVGNKVKVVLKTADLPKDQSARLYLSEKTNGFFLDVHHRKNLDVISAVFLEKYLNNLFNLQTNTPLRYQELLVNASNLDLDALLTLAKIKLQSAGEAAKDLSTHLHYGGSLRYIDGEADKIQEQIKEIKKHLVIQNKKKLIATNTKKAILESLDKAQEEGQLRQLIARNDRKGVARILAFYLPWEVMNTVEKNLWKEHLYVMANPLPLSKRVLIYRGIDGDAIYPAFKNGRYLTEKEAISSGELSLMAPMMARSKGTWNKRLRGLSDLDNRSITKYNNSSEYTKGSRLTALFVNHSGDPTGSPLLSLTPSYLVSNEFGGERNTLMAIDPRAIYYNFTSLFIEEHEFFIPLFTFPDEMLAVYDEVLYPGVVNPNQFMIGKAKQKLAQLTGSNSEDLYTQLINNGKKRFGYTANAIFKERRYQDEAMMKLFKKVSQKGIYSPLLTDKIKTIPTTCQESIRSFFQK